MSRPGCDGLCSRCLAAAAPAGQARSEARALWAEVLGVPTDGVCRHHCAYPPRLRRAGRDAPMLRVRGGAERLARLLDAPVVAILGTTAPTEYGLATARRLGEELGGRGATVAVALEPGIALAAHAGALACGGATVGVLAGDLARCSPCWWGADRRGPRCACAISELTLAPLSDVAARASAALLLALIADLAIVVEAARDGPELLCAQARRERGLALGAVPGRIDSPASWGSNALLRGGAVLLDGADAALELLASRGGARRWRREARHH